MKKEKDILNDEDKEYEEALLYVEALKLFVKFGGYELN